MSTRHPHPYDDGENDGDRPSYERVESFLQTIEADRHAATRTRWIAFAVAAAIGGVATLTALGIVPVEAENAALSATAVVASFTLGSR